LGFLTWGYLRANMENKQVFNNIKVAEFSWVVVGPSASRYLAEHGATVVKIESHKRLDTIRAASPFANNQPGPDTSMFYGRHNSNKLSVSIDLQSPGGKQLAWKLVRWADIITENFSPGTMEKMGFGYEEVKKVKPEIIYLSSSMQGRGGPHSQYAGYGQNAVNLCGFTGVSGWPDIMPAPPQGAYTDYICARFIGLGLIAALDYRRRTGRGLFLEQSQFESSLHFLAPQVMDYQINNRIMSRRGNRLDSAAPHGVFPSQGQDNWVAISVMNEEQWPKLCEAMDLPALSGDIRFATLQQRKKNEDELEKIIEDWTQRKKAEDIESLLQKAGVPANKVARPADVFADPQLQARQYFTELPHSAMGLQKFEAQSCFILSESPREIRTPSPNLGEHNEYVFKNLLGLSDEEISERIIDGSITTEITGQFKASM
jgi:benzylsuccinate CoA-transferase BbsF subunit